MAKGNPGPTDAARRLADNGGGQFPPIGKRKNVGTPQEREANSELKSK